MSDRAADSTRRFRRAPVSLEVQYRTAGSFLVSYSLNLSQGGLFLETPQLLPLGSKLDVRFSIPGAAEPIEAQARVMWVRTTVSAEGLPPGLGLAFDHLEQHIGHQIDALVRSFQGVTMLAVAADAPAADRLARRLRSILNCVVKRALSIDDAVGLLAPQIDLVIVEMDSLGAESLKLVIAAAEHAPTIPLVALARRQECLDNAAEAGAAAVFGNPPPHEQLRQRILELLGKPI